MTAWQPTTIARTTSKGDREEALRQIYAQVLERQPHAYERRELVREERDFLNGKLGVRHFLAALCQSSVYLNEFYHSCSNLKFVEWDCKHLLGRAPVDGQEVARYTDILLHHGTAALIKEILGSEEYRRAFGCFTVPYPRHPKFYPSTRKYLQSEAIAHEHYGQRGRTIPILHWQQLGLNCDGGTCLPRGGVSEAENLLRQLRQAKDPRAALRQLSPAQQVVLRQALRRG
jgi:hypothetical protein